MKKILREQYQTTDAYGEFEAVGLVWGSLHTEEILP